MSLPGTYHLQLDGHPQSSRVVRNAVREALDEWGVGALAQDAVLGASELASNAILHAASPYELALRQVNGGARIEVIDPRPDLVPLVVPVTGSTRTLVSTGTTGRGLRIVATLASRWGYTTSPSVKSVWMEITEPVSPEPTEPIIVEGHRETSEPDALAFHLESLPVRAAIASGIHVEELIREIQLASRTTTIDDAQAATLRELLDLTAPARLLGRHEAYSAAARDERRVSFELRLSAAGIRAFGALNALLTDISRDVGATIVPLPAEVTDFRGWLLDEISRQASGGEAVPCSLPD